MKKTARKFIMTVLGFAMLISVTSANAAPMVSYGVSGSSGNWTLDFSVTNTLGVNNLDIYFFGVQLPTNNVTGTPTNWSDTTWLTWTNSSYGGSGIVYNNNWINLSNTAIGNGVTLNGFQVKDTSASAPTSVTWFAYAYDFTTYSASYNGSDNFNWQGNPGFEGIATASRSNKVPEPGTMLLLASGLAGLAVFRTKLSAIK